MRATIMKELIKRANENVDFIDLATNAVQAMHIMHFTFDYNCYGATIKYRIDNPALTKTEQKYFEAMRKYAADWDEMMTDMEDEEYEDKAYKYYLDCRAQIRM